MIELRQISKTYDTHAQDFDALKNINLTVERGEIFGILGKSGAGKSTLLRCVNFLERPSDGKVFINNIDLSSLSEKQLREQRRKISIIFQHFNLLESRNVFDNIALPLEIAGKSHQAIQEKVSQLLNLVELQDKIYHFPSQLSGGQKQRVAIARALATDPDVLLSDEATSALDTESTTAILSLLKKINQEFGLTILLITHELEVIKQICDRAAVLDKGEIVEQSLAIDILINPQAIITRQLVQKSLHLPVMEKSKSINSLMLKLTFIGEDSDTPLISSLVKKFDIDINIQQAQIEHIQDIKVGFTICELTGNHIALKDALTYIQSTSIKVEVLNHV